MMDEYTASQVKALCVKHLHDMHIMKEYVKEFEKNDTVTLFERYAGFYIAEWNGKEYRELLDKIKYIEETFEGCRVYAVTHEYYEFGDCYTFLMCSKYKDIDFEPSTNNNYYCYAYCWNKTRESCSECGSVVVHSSVGGIRRYA